MVGRCRICLVKTQRYIQGDSDAIGRVARPMVVQYLQGSKGKMRAGRGFAAWRQ